MKRSTRESYERRIGKVVDYIGRHLDDDLSVERLSRVANFSPFHFHRQFAAWTGIGVYRMVQLLRLKRASFQLAFNRDETITRIAMAAGFENLESFSRAFKRAHGQTPSAFRAQPAWEPWREKYRFQRMDGEQTMQVKIVDFPETPVAAVEYRGPEAQVYEATRRLIDWRRANRVPPDSAETYGVHHTLDPDSVAPEDYRLDLGVSYRREVGDNPQGVVSKVIPGGRCAVARHHGSREHIPAARYLYAEWLPESGEELRDFPMFFHYVNVGLDIAEQDYVTDVYLPLKSHHV